MSGHLPGAITRHVGIGTVVAVCCVALVAAAGAVLSISPPAPTGYGQIRDYPSEPRVAWTVDSDTLPEYGQGNGITVAGTWMDRWLLSYPSGLGRAYLVVSAVSGAPVWHEPIRVGLGSCAVNDKGDVGCAVKLGAVPDGFYLVDPDSGKPGTATDLDATTQVTAVGTDFLRIDEAGYRVLLATGGGDELWTRTFASAMHARYANGQLVLTGADGTNVVVDPHTGGNLLRCNDCDVRIFPTGITVAHNTFGSERVDLYGVDDDVLATTPTHTATRMQVVRGPSTLPVLTGVGDATMQDTQGRYEIRNPAQPSALWAITDPELSKVGARPCGSVVSLARKDRSRAVYALADGTHLGNVAAPDPMNPDANIDQLACVGSSSDTMVFANSNQLTGFGIRTGTRWELPIIGTAQAVGGYVVLHQGQSMSVLAPE